MAGKQEVPSITTYIFMQIDLSFYYRFWYVANSMTLFILYFDYPIWPPNRKFHQLQLIFMQVS